MKKKQLKIEKRHIHEIAFQREKKNQQQQQQQQKQNKTKKQTIHKIMFPTNLNDSTVLVMS